MSKQNTQADKNMRELATIYSELFPKNVPTRESVSQLAEGHLTFRSLVLAPVNDKRGSQVSALEMAHFEATKIGTKTLVVDARLLNEASSSLGFCDFLSGSKADFSECVSNISEHLFCMETGRKEFNLSLRDFSLSLQRFMEEAKTSFELVIFVTTSVEDSIVGYHMCRSMNEVVLQVVERVTSVRELNKCKLSLSQNGISKISILMLDQLPPLLNSLWKYFFEGGLKGQLKSLKKGKSDLSS